jgi:hypothetical protein
MSSKILNSLILQLAQIFTKILLIHKIFVQKVMQPITMQLISILNNLVDLSISSRITLLLIIPKLMIPLLIKNQVLLQALLIN